MKTKTPEEIDIMHEGNLAVHACLDKAEQIICAGMTTAELNAVIEDELSKHPGAAPAFLGYNGFPAASCISVNEDIVHGIPGKRVLSDGDIVGVDFGVFYREFAADAARTLTVGTVKPKHLDLIRYTREALLLGIEQMVVGNRLHDIGKAIGTVASKHGYGNILGYTGHGIGRALHERPSVFNYVEPKEPNVRLEPGLVLALEPMFTLGGNDSVILDDGWTVSTRDGSFSAHWELSVAITKHGPRVLG